MAPDIDGHQPFVLPMEIHQIRLEWQQAAVGGNVSRRRAGTLIVTVPHTKATTQPDRFASIHTLSSALRNISWRHHTGPL
jgi:hypothetical protein